MPLSAHIDMDSDLFKELKACGDTLFLLAGPNVIQSEEHTLKMARQIKAVTDSLGVKLIFKSSWDKANRTSAQSFRGPGMEEGLRILKEVKTQLGVHIVTDIHEANQAEAVGAVADIIQIPGTSRHADRSGVATSVPRARRARPVPPACLCVDAYRENSLHHRCGISRAVRQHRTGAPLAMARM